MTYDEYYAEIKKLQDVISKLAAENRELQDKCSEWISVKDRLPENDDDVLVYVARRDVMDVDWYDENYQEWDTHCLDVTHWMSLPQLPKE